MTDLMQTIFDHIQEHVYKDFLPREYYWHLTRLSEKQESDLLKTLSDSQQDLLDQYESTQTQIHIHELEAMFQAAWNAARKLG